MKKIAINLLIFAVVAGNILIAAQSAAAGPGVKIAEAAFRTFWGRVILITLALFILAVTMFLRHRDLQTATSTGNLP
jgi:hypothetical protein